MNTYNEETSFRISVEFFDEDGAAFLPSTVRYKIECLTNRRSIRSYTTATPAQALDISVSPDDNVIMNDRNRLERRQMTIQTDYDTAAQKVFTREWDVRNLQ